jgi:hypothetical protein
MEKCIILDGGVCREQICIFSFRSKKIYLYKFNIQCDFVKHEAYINRVFDSLLRECSCIWITSRIFFWRFVISLVLQQTKKLVVLVFLIILNIRIAFVKIRHQVTLANIVCNSALVINFRCCFFFSNYGMCARVICINDCMPGWFLKLYSHTETVFTKHESELYF